MLNKRWKMKWIKHCFFVERLTIHTKLSHTIFLSNKQCARIFCLHSIFCSSPKSGHFGWLASPPWYMGGKRKKKHFFSIKPFFRFPPIKSPTTQNDHFLDLSKKWNVSKISGHTARWTKKIMWDKVICIMSLSTKKNFLFTSCFTFYSTFVLCPFLWPRTVRNKK